MSTQQLEEGTIMSTLTVEEDTSTKNRINEIAIAITGWQALNNYLADDDEILDLLRERELEDSDDNLVRVREALARLGA